MLGKWGRDLVVTSISIQNILFRTLLRNRSSIPHVDFCASLPRGWDINEQVAGRREKSCFHTTSCCTRLLLRILSKTLCAFTTEAPAER